MLMSTNDRNESACKKQRIACSLRHNLPSCFAWASLFGSMCPWFACPSRAVRVFTVVFSVSLKEHTLCACSTLSSLKRWKTFIRALAESPGPKECTEAWVNSDPCASLLLVLSECNISCSLWIVACSEFRILSSGHDPRWRLAPSIVDQKTGSCESVYSGDSQKLRLPGILFLPLPFLSLTLLSDLAVFTVLV